MDSILDSILKFIGVASPILFVFSIFIGVVLAKLINSKNRASLAYLKALEDEHRINELKKRIKGLKFIAEELDVKEEDLERFLLLVKASKEIESAENNASSRSVGLIKNLSEYLTNKTPLDPLMKELPK